MPFVRSQALWQIYKLSRCRGEAAAINVVETMSLVSPPPRPSSAVIEEGSGNRETRPPVFQQRLSRLPDPYPTLDYFVNPQQPAAG